LDELGVDLQTVEYLALATAPEPTGKFHLPDRQARSPLSFITGMQPFPRLALSALAVVLLMGAVLLMNSGQENRPLYEASQTTVDPDQLLSEIDELVETPFAWEFQLTTSTNELDADEDFMDYIVPLIDNDPITRSTGRKGEYLC